MLEGEADCPECGAPVELEADWYFHDRYDLELEVDATCTNCIFSYDGRIPAKKMGGSLGIIVDREGGDDA